MYRLVETQILALFEDGAFELSSFVFVVECVKLLVVVEDLVDHAVIVDIEKVDQRNRLVRGAAWNQFFIRDLKAEFPGFLHVNFIVMLLRLLGYLAQVDVGHAIAIEVEESIRVWR